MPRKDKTVSPPRRMIGFWHSKQEPWWPKPFGFGDPTWDSETREIVASHLDRGQRMMSYGGFSECRFCGCHNGSSDLSDGVYLWPAGLAHYLREHLVRLPEEFVAHALKLRGRHQAWKPNIVAMQKALKLVMEATNLDPETEFRMEQAAMLQDAEWWIGVGGLTRISG